LEFLNTIQDYDVVIVIDDNIEKYYEKNKEIFDTKYPNIIIVQFEFIQCIEYGFQLSSLTLNKTVAGWDKALFYNYLLYKEKIKLKKQYQHIWFIEDDVFFYEENILKNIDANYPNSDLLCKEIHEKKENEEWLWNFIHIHNEDKRYKALVCACRMSQKLLNYIFEYVENYKQLFFIEAMFPTIAMKHNLQCDFPIELRTLEYNKPWVYNEINKTNLFHPIKMIEFHEWLREDL